jgi:NSS family neurotransmitter:Na+ symporter
MTMTGVAVGLGNVWRFPYMVGKFGGASFVLFYLISVFAIGIPALMAEWALGRHTQRGTLGAFEAGGFPGGRYVGMFLFFVVLCATGYYSNAIGWVGYFIIIQVINAFGATMDPSTILPPDEGFRLTSLLLQLLMTGTVILLCAIILLRGLRRGIERISRFIMPTLLVILLILIIRAVTLPGAARGLWWYIGGLRLGELSGAVMAAALGQAVFSLSLGGTFMVVYGSYLDRSVSIPRNATFTGLGDLLAGLLAGLAIFPAVFAFGLEPNSGPGLIFFTLPKTFAMMPLGWLFGLMFFCGLFAVAYLSDVAAFEVLVAGLTDNTRLKRSPAVWLTSGIVYLLAIPSMINLKVFIPWDLTFGSGMQTLGTILAVVTAVWCLKRSEILKEITSNSDRLFFRCLYWWMRLFVPAAILFVGINWLLESVFDMKLLG